MANNEEMAEGGRDLVSEVEKRLADDERLEISHLRVLASDGEVVLAGEVPNLFQRDLAGQIAGQVDGVRRVVNQLAVTRETEAVSAAESRGWGDAAKPALSAAEVSLTRDEQMAREVLAALTANRLVNEHLIYVHVQDGIVYLEGELTSEDEKKEAEAIASLTPGAQEVVNRIKVVPVQPRPDDEVEGNVRAALLQELLLGPSEIDVEVSGGVVRLQGSVWSHAMRDRVEAVAARALGVRRVVNELSVKERKAS